MHPGPKKVQYICGQSNAPNNLGGHRLSDHPNTVVMLQYTTNEHKLSDPTKSNNPNSIHPSNSINTASLNKYSNKNISLTSNQGPKRGYLYGSKSIHNCSIIESNKKSGKKTIVPLSEDANGKMQFVQNEGPKRGIPVGQNVFHQSVPKSSQNGPRRGVGYMNITNQLYIK